MSKPLLLFISPVIPSPSGNGRTMRAYNILVSLSEKYSVYLLVIPTPGIRSLPINPYIRILCKEVVYLSSGFFKNPILIFRHFIFRFIPRIFQFFHSKPLEWLYITSKRIKKSSRLFPGISFDVIHVFRLYMTPYVKSVADKDFSGTLQLDLDDIESLSRKRLANCHMKRNNLNLQSMMLSEAIRYQKIEDEIIPQYHRIFVCSENDRRMLSNHYPSKSFEILPNVFKLQKININNDVTIPFKFLFVGSLNYFPNIDGILYFCEDILPLIKRIHQNFVIEIIGRGLPKKIASKLQRIKEVRLTGEVEHVGPQYHNSGAAIIPLRTGAGTRIKVLEAFAYNVPVISTSLGIEGIEAENGKHVLLGDSPDFFARCCIKIINDEKLRNKLVGNAFLLLKKKYSLEKLKEFFQS